MSDENKPWPSRGTMLRPRTFADVPINPQSTVSDEEISKIAEMVPEEMPSKSYQGDFRSREIGEIVPNIQHMKAKCKEMLDNMPEIPAESLEAPKPPEQPNETISRLRAGYKTLVKNQDGKWSEEGLPDAEASKA